MKVEFKLPKKVKSKWVKALRGGEYTQGRKMLKEVHEEYDYDTGKTTKTGVSYCCLGVARDIGLCERKKPTNKNDACNEEFVSTSFLPMDIQMYLADKNDGGEIVRRWSFNKIANWIEKNL